MIGSILNRIKNNRGLSLIEVLVAVVLLGATIVPMAGLLNDQLAITVNSGKQFLATQLAVEKIEEIVSETRKRTANGATGNNPKGGPHGGSNNKHMYDPAEVKTEVLPGFFRTVERVEVSKAIVNNGNGNGNSPTWEDYLMKYVVTVSWNNDADKVTMYVYHTEV